jgi:hypothetical protein
MAVLEPQRGRTIEKAKRGFSQIVAEAVWWSQKSQRVLQHRAWRILGPARRIDCEGPPGEEAASGVIEAEGGVAAGSFSVLAL